MKRLQILGVLALAIAPLAMSAQEGVPGSINQSPIMGGGQVLIKNSADTSVSGTMYLNERFLGAYVDGGTELSMVRYNAYHDNFEKMDPKSGSFSPMPKTPEGRIKLTGEKKEYALVGYVTKKKQPVNGYLIVLSEAPNATIYKKESIALIPRQESQNSYSQTKPATYKRAGDEFYIKTGTSAITPMPDNKKDFAKLFPGKEKAILDFIKQNKIDLDKDQDIVKLGSYLQTI